MLFALLYLLLLSAHAIAQGPTSGAGTQFTCPTGDNAVQAYAPLCPLSLADGSGTLRYKSDFVVYQGAPASFRTQTTDSIGLSCDYAVSPGSQTLTRCFYAGGAGSTLRLITYGQPTTCFSTTVNNGADPKPSGGGNFRKRQTGADVQAHQPAFVCPQLGGILYLRSTTFTYQPFDTRGALPENLSCSYRDTANSIFATCVYRADTGVYTTTGIGTSRYDARCPSAACASSMYVSTMRKRSITRRQVKAANIRAAAGLRQAKKGKR